MKANDNNTSRECKLCLVLYETRYKLINHIKKIHKIDWVGYILKTKYACIAPLCNCGCGQQTVMPRLAENFNAYLHGHNPIIISKDIRKQIGKKNSVKLKQYFDSNPEIAIEKAQHMRSFVTNESREKARKNIKKTLNTPELKKKISLTSERFWRENPEKRKDASRKCKKTYNERLETGAYDAMIEKMSVTMTQKLINNERIWQRGIYEPKKSNRICRFKSSYEIELMHQLDASTLVISWLYEQLWLYYNSADGVRRRYVPDIIATLNNGKRVMIECKPKKLHEHNNYKIIAAKDYCKNNSMTYVLWEPEDGIIDNILSKL